MLHPFPLFKARSICQVVLQFPELGRVLGRAGGQEAHPLELPLRLRLHPQERLAHDLEAVGQLLHLHPDVRLERRAGVPFRGSLALHERSGLVEFGEGDLVDRRLLLYVVHRVVDGGVVGSVLEDLVAVVVVPHFLLRRHLRVRDEVDSSVRGLDVGEPLQAGVLVDFEVDLGFQESVPVTSGKGGGAGG